MKMGVKIAKGANTVQEEMAKRVRQNDEDMETVRRVVAHGIKDEAVQRIRNSAPRGTIQRRYRPARVVQASAPGQAPAIDLGNFIRSIGVQIIEGGYLVGSSLKLGAWLEFGTRHMAARPWLRPAARLYWKKRAPEVIKRILRFKE